MKRYLAVLLLMTMVVGACHNDKPIGPPDLLYKRWHLNRTRDVNSTDWKTWDTDGYYTVEYRQDSSLVYQRNTVQIPAGCCSPAKFSRQGVLINYTEFSICPTVFCATVNQTVITELTENLLELNDGYKVSQYELAK